MICATVKTARWTETPLLVRSAVVPNSLVTLGMRFCSLLYDFSQLVDFATKYLRKNSSLCVEIHVFLLSPEEEIAILVKKFALLLLFCIEIEELKVI